MRENISIVSSKKEVDNILRQDYSKAVPFTIEEDSKIVNAENITATLIVPESCFPYSGDWIGGFKDGDNNYHYRSQIGTTLDHIFLRAYIENDDMTDRKREFNLVFCPNDPDPKVKELVRVMAFSGQEIVSLLLIGPYRHGANAELLKLDRKCGVHMLCRKAIAQPDLMRHYVSMNVRASDVAFSKTIEYYQSIPADFIPVITKYCDICRKHFMQTVRD